MSLFGRREVMAGGLALAGLGPVAARAASSGAPRRVIIDTDPGVDDSMALLIALRAPEFKVEALTVTSGNVPLEVTLKNTLRMAELAERPDTPVAAGAPMPLRRIPVSSSYVHGENGIGGVPLPEPRIKPLAETAPDLIRRMVRASPGEISLITLGPLTNIAMAFQADPQLPKMIQSLTMMGGSLSGGNITPAAEFNLYTDPEAAQIVFQAGVPAVSMVGLDVTRQAAVTDAHIERLETAAGTRSRICAQILRGMQAGVRRSGADGGRVLAHDSMAVSSLIDPTLLRFDDVHIEVETSGELTAGATLGYRRSPMRRSAAIEGVPHLGDIGQFTPNARAAVGVEADRFLDFFVTRLIRG